MSHVGNLLPILLREAIDDGFHRHAQSRRLDPDGFVDYGKGCRGGMLYSRIASSARYLIESAKSTIPHLRYEITSNEVSTEIMLGPFLIFRLKRIKKNRKNLTTGVLTARQAIIRSPICQSVGQMPLPFPDNVDYLPMVNRVWVTAAWDLDELEEGISRAVIGVETRKRWMWLQPLSAVEPEVIARLPAPVADRIHEVRQRRAV